MKRFLFFIVLFVIIGLLLVQISVKLMCYFDVFQDQIIFVYGGDLWVVFKIGGMVIQVIYLFGEEFYLYFFFDGKIIVYMVVYNGNFDVYIIFVMGGVL